MGKFYNGSLPFEWSLDDTWTIAKGAGLAAAGAVAVYLGNLEFEMSTMQGVITAAVVSVAANALRKWMSNTTNYTNK